ncbi:GPI ethanolamine phosphate transferase 2 isoform X4 [Myotis daubentonii]|uniref:GPI ethanolamine phosphate transferase 2 isoform X4 n=1 Tax=Myotis daubentonii TaxID=98922 RepID=UPI0028730E28|nr:GPI ethanolamine phosphate transferase 2 isoform X4 [Myotis daubentonii]
MRLGCGAFAAGCVVIEVLGVALFLRGFFPAPARPEPEPPAAPAAPEPMAGASSNWTERPPPLFRKVVIMLIDALRDDFVFGSKGVKFMPYTTYLVEKGAAHSFVAEAKPPTVTMPRVKALMTGSLPGFVDVVRNLNSPALLEDNVVTQAKAAGKRIIFYGDETWVKLFPKHFVEYDGTTSFFVSDYTEVDDNVTRHLDKVLKRGDWDVLILHYLGLDHIGHISGPSSPLIGRKLSEMDSILMRIHTSLLSEEREALSPNLLVLCGDHGMSESGGHGASSLEEVNTALLLTSSAFERKPGEVRPPERVQQTDLAATLAVGLGLPIPQHSVGRFLFPVVQGRALRQQLRLLHLNAVQLSRLLRARIPGFEREHGFEQFKISERLHGNWVKLYLEENNAEILLNMGAKARKQYLYTLKALSQALSSQEAQYDIYSMVVGTVVVLEKSAPSHWKWSELDFLILAGTAGHVLSLGASSFIEEEHQTWYFLVSTLCLALSHESYRSCFLGDDEEPEHCPQVAGEFARTASALPDRSVSCNMLELDQARQSPSSLDGLRGREKCMALASPWLILGCCRLLRSLNQTGVQWAHRPDLGHWLTSSDHQAELSVLAALSLLAIFALVQSRCSSVAKGALALGLLGVYCYRAATGSVLSPWQQDNKDVSRGIIEARFVYVFVLGILFMGIKDMLKSQVHAAGIPVKTVGLWDVYSGLVLLAALLFRPHNLPVLVCSLLIQTLMTKFIWRPLRHGAAEVTVMHYWFGQAFFYFQGNSNNIATVDISAGFVGLNTYVEVPAMFLTAFATYAGPVLWASHLANFLSWGPNSGSALRRACFCYALLSSVPVSAYVVLVTALRYHLFIWSVFSPKLLYEGMRLLVTAALCLSFTAVDRAGAKADAGKVAHC